MGSIFALLAAIILFWLVGRIFPKFYKFGVIIKNSLKFEIATDFI